MFVLIGITEDGLIQKGRNMQSTLVAYLHPIKFLLCIDYLPIFSTRHC